VSIVKQTGPNPNSGKVTTSMGLREPRAPLCTRCRERKNGQLYTLDANNQLICSDCANPRDQRVLKGTCDPENCACARTTEPE
jgi:hypothetical protein